ncbi:DEAD/DEAH box helicase [Chloroflexota bacterium]
MPETDFLGHLTRLPSYRGQVVHVERIPPRRACYGELRQSLHPSLTASLEASRLLPLYTHQARAVDASLGGENVMVVTPAASGKTLCYNAPVLDSLLRHRGSSALYLFPTKALAQDQLRGLDDLTSPASLGIDLSIFDGDTPTAERAGIKKSARIVLSNPDMLHLGILPNHRSWARLLSSLEYVVIDEAHVYGGIFGSHVGSIVRRLRRLCTLYGSSPRFICCSATIANPAEHIAGLIGLPFTVIDEDGSPSGGKDFAFWNPPIIDEARSARRSSNIEATQLMAELVRCGFRSLAFARSRRLAELIYIYIRDELAKTDPQLAGLVSPYRAGYLAEERRRIEKDLFEGRLLGVVATTALELGIDIGDLDATVLAGYPGSIASTWQQAGRSGRGGKRATSFLVGLDDPLDQYLMRHPEAFFAKSSENVLINPANPHILGPHLLCAAWEHPLSTADEKLFGPAFGGVAADLEERGLLRSRGRRKYPSATLVYPAQDVNIRSASSANYTLVDSTSGQLLETVEESVALFQVHPGAVYLHRGDSYLVTVLDLDARTAYARPADVPYYTQAKDITDIGITRRLREKAPGGVGVYLGEVRVTTAVVGFRKKRILTEEVVGEEPLELPPWSFPTIALWFDIPPRIVARLVLEKADLAGGLHAAEHAAIALLPLFALCDRNDIGGVSIPLHPDTGRAQIFIYDAHPGGVGIAEKGFDLVSELWEATLKAVSECPCEDGCPGCVQSPKCGNNNQPLDKGAAGMILEGLLGKA